MKRSESFSPSLFTLCSEFIAICRASYDISMTAAVCLGQLSLTLRRVRPTGPRRFMSVLAQEDDALQRGANQFECRKPTREDPFWHEAIVSKMDPGLAKKKLLGNVASPEIQFKHRQVPCIRVPIPPNPVVDFRMVDELPWFSGVVPAGGPAT
jgi:hypothetical protein